MITWPEITFGPVNLYAVTSAEYFYSGCSSEVERLPSKQNVVGSNPTIRSIGPRRGASNSQQQYRRVRT